MSAPNQAPMLKVPTPGNRPKPRLMIPSSAAGKPFNSTTGVPSFPDTIGPGNASGGVGGVAGDFSSVGGGNTACGVGGNTGPVAAYNDAADRTAEDSENNPLGQPISSAAQYQAAVPAPLAIGVPSSGSSPAPRRTSGARPALPKLQLAMPKSNTGKNTPQPLQVGTIPGPSQQQQQQQQQSQQSSSISGSAPHSRSGSYPQGTGSANNPASASGSSSSYSALSLAMGMKQSHSHGSGDASGMGSVYEEGTEDLARDLDKLSLALGRPVDADDLDDEGWLAARTSGRIVELDVLGEGAGGAVTKCKLRDGKTVFALKVITTDPNPDVKKQIFREINFNKDCRSDYICRYYGAFMDRSSSTISIAMEFCEGGSLDSIYREVKNLGGRTGEKVLGKVAEGVLNGLTYLHSLKIIHRDIKPSNILLCRNGQVKLCDFGVSGEFGTKGVANTFIGTHYYMAPERITGKPYTITSDVWSLGVTLLEVAQHRFPFPADGTEMQPKSGLIDLLTYIVRQPIPKLKDEPDNGVRWSENFKSFIDYSLERDANVRQPPWQMLEHPWMVEMRPKKVNMALFLKKVWDWKD